MNMEDIRNLPDDDLSSEIGKTRKKIFKMSFQAKGTAVESPGTLRLWKKDVAKMLTVLRERDLARAKKS